MKFFYFLFFSISIIGCQNQKEPSIQFPNKKLRIFTDSLESMTFKAPEKYFIQDGFYTFSSIEKDFKITLEKLVSENWGVVFSKEDLINNYKKGLNNVFIELKDNWFIVKGLDSNNNIIKIKGIYLYVDRLLSKEENPGVDKKYILLTSKAAIMKIVYSKKNDKKNDKISKLILDSFNIVDDNF